MKKILTITLTAILVLTTIPAISAETTASNGTLVVGTPVELNADGLTAICRDISRDSNSVWIEFEKDGEVRYSHILKQDDPIVYRNGSDLLTYRIDAIFHGTQTNMAMISPIVDPSSIDLSNARTQADSILLSVGERYNLSNGTEIMHRMMGVNGDKVWIEVMKNGTAAFSHIMTEDTPIVYKNDSDEWVAYQIDAIFCGFEHGLIELSPVDLPIDQSIINFNNVHGLLHDNFILDVGEENDLGGGITLRCTGIDRPDGAAWIELSKNGTVQYSHILHEGEYFTYEDDETGILRCCGVHRVFTGEQKLMNTPVILKDGEMVNTGFTVAERELVEFSPISPIRSDFDVSSVPDRSEYIMVGPGPMELSGGVKLLCKEFSHDGERVWIEIKRNEYEISSKVINRTHPSFAYRVGDTEYVYDLEAVFLGKQKSAIEISFVGSSPVSDGDADVLNHTPVSTVPAFTAFTAIVVLGLLAVVYARRRRHS